MSFDIVRGVISKPRQTQIVVNKVIEYMGANDDNGTLHLGYPLTASNDAKITLDALLITEKRGMIAFIFAQHGNQIEKLKDEQDALYFHMDFYLKKYGSLRKGRSLVFDPIVITVLIDPIDDDQNFTGYHFADPDKIVNEIKSLPEFNKDYYRNLCEALQKVANIRPVKKRANVTSSGSKGFVLREMEKEIANLDEWQKKAALEVPEGPQRIRGLAGTGKTIVLALKAAYLHTQHPDWVILVTFYTRSLKQQYEELISKFVGDFSGDKPDWNRLKIQHSWGSKIEDGVYFNLTQQYRAPYHTLTSAINNFGRSNPFKGMCEELLQFAGGEASTDIFDAVLVDEAQDLPSAFFQLLFRNTKNPKRIIWAYDELQNLSDVEMPSLYEMFGSDEHGDLLINIDNISGEPQKDIMLPICYRNPPWTLAMAHALGFGLYNDMRKLPIQTFDNPKLWRDIGYSVINGRLEYGRNVTLERKNDATPAYFERLIERKESIYTRAFGSKEEQYDWVAKEIKKNLSDDELDPDDILVVFPDSYTSKSEYANFEKYLSHYAINSFLAGINSSQDMFKMPGCITCSGIFRAKGNEAPMVYIVNSEYCADGYELIKLRNILFTAITRSRAWVRIIGVGEKFQPLAKEFEKCENQGYKLSFKIPTRTEMEKIRKLNREPTEEEKQKAEKAVSNVNELISMLERGEIDKESIPGLETLINILIKKRK